VGLVAITPAAGFVSPMSALVIGAMAAVPSYYGVLWRARTRLDDSLDVVAAHGLGGTVGALMTGIFAQRTWGSPADGLLFGNPSQLLIQLIAILAVIAFSAVGTAVVMFAVGLITPLRATVGEEGTGLDVSQHGEEAYGRGEGAVLVLRPRRAETGADAS
jgi:Amt family ammonium transporter